jgi:hypothetical protein
MATPRTKDSTISDTKDPLAGVSYIQNRPQRPIDSLISDTTKEAPPEPRRKPEPEPEETTDQKAGKGKITVLVENDLLERLRNAAWWQRRTLATLAEEGVRLVVERLERQHGGPFEPREENLKTGRPQGSRNTANKAR